MPDIQGSKIMVIEGGAGSMGSHVVDEIPRENITRVTVSDNFC